MTEIIEQTPKEKVKMYMKCSKKELIDMLIQCNRILENQPAVFTSTHNSLR